jgi:uncharacterized protein (TIGR03083 family)
VPNSAFDDRTAAYLDALRSSVDRLRALVGTLTEDDLTTPAYPSEWSIADVLSHLGSGAVITRRTFHDALSDLETPEDFAPSVWDEWNHKTSAQQRQDALEVDAQLMTDLDAVPDEDRARATFPMGPMSLDFTEFVAMRLNEHAFHTWDIEIVRDEAATLPPHAAELVIDNLELVARFTAKPTGDSRTIRVATTDPVRGFTIDLAPDAATFQTAEAPPDTADLNLPAEALARLVYGRLDPATTPAAVEGDLLHILRKVFPGP